MKIPLISKETLGVAAEYAVASELCRRGIYAQLTLGNRKSTDILVDYDKGKMLRIQVKAKQKREWPAIKGISRSSDIMILVDYENRKEMVRPDFYILSFKDWRDLLNTSLVKSGKVEAGHVSIDNESVPIWNEGFKGIAVRPAQISKHLECWGKVNKHLGIPIDLIEKQSI